MNSLTRILVAGALLAGSNSLFAQVTLNANAGPANNGGSATWAMFFDVAATAGDLTVTEMTTASTAAANAAFSVEVLTFVGSGLGGPVGSGPGSSPTGWTSLGSVPATQGAVASAVSLPIDIPDIVVLNGQTVGVAVRFTSAGPRYFGTGTPPLGVYSDANLSLTTGQARSAPFTTGGSFFTSRELVGSLTYVLSGGPVAYCTGKINSAGCTPAIGSTGTMSATATSGFILSATNELNNKVGLVLYSEFGRDASPFGTGGILCVKAPTRRSKGFNSGGNAPPAIDCTGVFSIDFNAFARGLLGTPPNPAAYLSLQGQVVTAQFWGRDPGYPAPDNFSLSNGLEFTVGP